MPEITDAEIRQLATQKAHEQPVISCYLDIDGRRHVRPADYERVADSLFRRARSREMPPAVAADLSRIEARIAQGFDRSHVRGVALFACSEIDLFEVVELPVGVRNQLTMNQAPSVGQLEVVCQQSEKIAVLAADKQHARVFVFRFGELVEHSERTDDLGRDYDKVGEHDRGTPDHHREEMAHAHLRAAAELLWTVFRDEGFDHLVLAVPDHLESEVEQDLHPYLQERLRGRLGLSPKATTAEVRAAVVEAERRIEAEREASLVAELREQSGAGSRGVVGLEATLGALADRRIDRLLVSDGFERQGWLCEQCSRLATVGRMCSCGSEMVPVADLVQEAVEEALAQACRVDVCTDNADLDVLGQIGALLRY